MNEIMIVEDAEAAASHAAEIFIKIVTSAISERGRFFASLSGGSTPKRLYQLLSSENNKERTDWTKCTFFIGDERNVPPDDEHSNFRMIRETLQTPLEPAVVDIRPWPVCSGTPDGVASMYEHELENVFGLQISPGEFTENIDVPVFDLFLLGLGGDCHTASLFPDTDALLERRSFAVANRVPQLDEIRYTLVFPVINASRNVLFLVTGEDKAKAVAAVIEGERDQQKKPAQAVQPHSGSLIWLLDRAAASALREV
jgi:6-phosphogluconolactonase